MKAALHSRSGYLVTFGLALVAASIISKIEYEQLGGIVCMGVGVLGLMFGSLPKKKKK